MSCTSCLNAYDDYMVTYCPACGERMELDEFYEFDTLDDGTKEYYLECPNEDCQCRFYANENY